MGNIGLESARHCSLRLSGYQSGWGLEQNATVKHMVQKTLVIVPILIVSLDRLWGAQSFRRREILVTTIRRALSDRPSPRMSGDNTRANKSLHVCEQLMAATLQRPDEAGLQCLVSHFSGV